MNRPIGLSINDQDRTLSTYGCYESGRSMSNGNYDIDSLRSLIGLFLESHSENPNSH